MDWGAPFAKAWNTASEVGKDAARFVSSSADAAYQKAIKPAAEFVADTAEQSAIAARDGVVSGYNTTKDGVVSGYNATKDGVVSGYNTTKDGVVTGYNATKDGVVSGYNATKDGVISGYAAAKSGIASTADNVLQKGAETLASNSVAAEAAFFVAEAALLKSTAGSVCVPCAIKLREELKRARNSAINNRLAGAYDEATPPEWADVSQAEWDFVRKYYVDNEAAIVEIDDFIVTPEVILHWARNEFPGADRKKIMDQYKSLADFEKALKDQAGPVCKDYSKAMNPQWGKCSSCQEPSGDLGCVVLAPDSEAAFHRTGLKSVKKYTSCKGYEWVFDTSQNAPEQPLVTSTLNKGTYNYDNDEAGHFTEDIVPWAQWGSGPDDPTRRSDRAGLMIKGGYGKGKAFVNDWVDETF